MLCAFTKTFVAGQAMSERCLKWLLLAPTLIVVAAMAAFPLGYSLVLSFRQWKLAQSNTPGDFIGLQNYTNLLSDDPEFWDSVRVTLVFVGADVLVTLAIALSVALLLRKKGRVNSLARVLLMLPFVMSPALIGISFRFFLNPEYGAFQAVLATAIPWFAGKVWLADSTLSMIAVVASDVWHWAPYMTLVMLGGLASIPAETQESAKIDGASSWAVFRDITLPQLKPVIGIILLLKTVFALKAFDTIYTLSSGGPGTSTQTLAYFVYQTAFNYYDMGYAAAAAYVLTAVLMVLAGFYLRLLFKKPSS
jgi:multiple sugar transport system permease protein